VNSKQAKEIRLVYVMERLGLQVIQKERGGQEHKYLSPFRDEVEPSFNVNLLKNAWFDFGEGQGGNTLDFAIRYLQAIGQPSQVQDALSWLKKIVGDKDRKLLSSFSQQKAKPLKEIVEYDLELVSVGPIQHPTILFYLTTIRKFPEWLIHIYLKEVTYKNKRNGKKYFAFGMKNQSGGYEIRAASNIYPFKSVLGGRDITLIKGQGAGKEIAVFEGMTDFLSLCAIKKARQLEYEALIMHSVSSYKRVIEVIQINNYEKLYAYLDNDIAGRKLTNRLEKDFLKDFYDKSYLYEGYDDLNEAWVTHISII
jgi:hypothetical protein